MKLQDFPSILVDDMQPRDGEILLHVTNTVLPVLCDNGRNEIFFDAALAALAPGLVMFVARFTIDYHTELRWQQQVEIGTGIKSLGRSSVVVAQSLFQNGKCAASAETVMVQVDLATSLPMPLSDVSREFISRFMLA